MTVMFRPVGPKELARIRELGGRAFPPRLPSQPIFYPVLNEFYARKIARDWNATKADTGYRGYVVSFEVNARYVRRFDVQTVGASWARELWVPAEDLGEFNRHIEGLIEVIAEYDGSGPGAPIDRLKGSRNTCPVCGYPDLCEPPYSAEGDGSFEICESCGFQFGVSDDDGGSSHVAWRSAWIGRGLPWSSTNPPPARWDARQQIERIDQRPD